MWDTRLNYQLLGDNSQVLEINIEPNKTLIADGSALLYTDEEIILELKNDDGVSNIVENSPKNKNKEQDESEEENEPFPNFANPNWEFEDEENENPIPKKNKFKDFDEEEETEKNQGLLEKFWGAAKKKIGKIFKPKNKNEEEQEEENLPDLDNIFSRNEPKEKTSSSVKSSFYDDFKLDDVNDLGNENESENSFSWYLTHCTNQSEYIRTLAFTAGSQGRFVVIDLNEPYENTIIIQNGCFVCGRKGVKLNTFIDTDILISKENQKFLKLDSLVGNDYVFLKAGGFVIVKDLENDGIRINANALLAYEYSLDLIWENAEKVTAMNTDNENYLVTLSGTGRFWLQTNYAKLMYENISPFIQKIITQEKEQNTDEENNINDFLLAERERIDKQKDKEEEKEDLDLPKL